MKRIILLLVSVSLTIMLTTSCQSKIEKWEADFVSFTVKNKSVAQSQIDKFKFVQNEIKGLRNNNSFLVSVDKKASLEKKEVKLNLSEENGNTLFLEHGDLDIANGIEDTAKLYNPYTDPLYLISYTSRLAQGNADEIVWVKQIRDKNFDFHPYSHALISYNQFKERIQSLQSIEYLLVSVPHRVSHPDMVDMENYYGGNYTGLVFLFDNTTTNPKLIDTFTFYAKSSENVFTSNAWVSNEDLDKDINRNLNDAFNARLRERYTISASALPEIEFYNYDYLKDKL